MGALKKDLVLPNWHREIRNHNITELISESRVTGGGGVLTDNSQKVGGLDP